MHTDPGSTPRRVPGDTNDPGPTDVADLFEGGSARLSHGGRAFRRALILAFAQRGGVSPGDAMQQADRWIETLTGRRPQ